MLRFLISVVFRLVANTVGLVVAAAVLDDVTLNATGFVTAVIVFTVVEIITQPLVQNIAVKHSAALLGSSALVASLVGLVAANWVSDGLQISGALTWVVATVIVWAAALLAALLLPAVMFKRIMQGDASSGSGGRGRRDRPGRRQHRR